MSTKTATMRTAAEIREAFVRFFKDRGHTFAPSSPVVPHDDPTLLFANAGMNQFKDVFLGRGSRPYVRAVNSQKCIRAGGKHNDLEDVGRDTYHHTFFEMLGNWSFGDYFKADAIAWAWELLTDVWGVDEDRLFATVFGGSVDDGLAPDEEAEKLFRRHLPAERVARFGKEDNFWEMGTTGPCGPCAEIHYDSRPDAERAVTPMSELVNQGHPDVIEIWNLVFIQFNRGDDGGLAELPDRHVDTGMGFERIVRVLQAKRSNYDTDIWSPIFDAIRTRTGARLYQASNDDPIDVAYRVVADHMRCLTVAISDGATPSNEGRGYVLRRILRRAVRHAHQTLGGEGPLLCDLVPTVVASLVPAYSELQANPDRVAAIIRDEEESFLRTLDRGIALFEDATGAAVDKRIGADAAFKLHDTYGFPIDLTRVMAEEQGLTIDEVGYEERMTQARQRSRQGASTGEETLTLPPEAIAKLRHLGIGPTRDIDKYHGRPMTAHVQAIWNGRDFDNYASIGETVGVILNRTNAYAESGGQVGDQLELAGDVFDAGTAGGRGHGAREATGDSRFVVESTSSFGGFVVHVGQLIDGKLRVGDEITATLDRDRRRATMANHTATHLLNHALRAVLGGEVQQRGSLVAPDRLRFDFSHPHAMTSEELVLVEKRVNEAVARRQTVYADSVLLETAMQINGVRAIFGERYPDPVRVVSVGTAVEELVADPVNPRWLEHSIEFCGGTHIDSTEEAQSFVIVSEQGLAAGVRRIVALTGVAARAAELAARDLTARLEGGLGLTGSGLVEVFDELTAQFDHLTLSIAARHELAPGLDVLRRKAKAVRKEEHGAARNSVVDQARTIAEQSDGSIIVEVLSGADKETLLAALDVVRSKRPDAATLLLSPDEDEGRVVMAAAVPAALISRGLKAGDWVRETAKECGGGGGGRPDLAQAGGKDPSRIADAVAAARSFAQGALA